MIGWFRNRCVVNSCLTFERKFSNSWKYEVADLSFSMGNSFPDFSCRNDFLYDNSINWYPGHMHSSQVAMDRWMDKLHVVVEVRDARAPLSTSQFRLMQRVPKDLMRIVVLNKADLISIDDGARAKSLIEAQGFKCILTSAKRGKGVSNIRRALQDSIKPSHKTVGLWMMIMGLPNVGKSSIISALKTDTFHTAWKNESESHLALGLKATKPKVGMDPGQTKHVGAYQISAKPKIFMIDTPGVMFLQSDDQKTNLKVAALGCVSDVAAGELYVADYVLWELNRRKMYHYVHVLNLTKPTNDVRILGAHIAQEMKIMNSESYPDFKAGVLYFLRLFRNGHFGHFLMDELPSDEEIDKTIRNLKDSCEPPGPWGPREFDVLKGGLMDLRTEGGFKGLLGTGQTDTQKLLRATPLRGNEGLAIKKWKPGSGK